MPASWNHGMVWDERDLKVHQCHHHQPPWPAEGIPSFCGSCGGSIPFLVAQGVPPSPGDTRGDPAYHPVLLSCTFVSWILNPAPKTQAQELIAFLVFPKIFFSLHKSCWRDTPRLEQYKMSQISMITFRPLNGIFSIVGTILVKTEQPQLVLDLQSFFTPKTSQWGSFFYRIFLLPAPMEMRSFSGNSNAFYGSSTSLYRVQFSQNGFSPAKNQCQGRKED